MVKQTLSFVLLIACNAKRTQIIAQRDTKKLRSWAKANDKKKAWERRRKQTLNNIIFIHSSHLRISPTSPFCGKQILAKQQQIEIVAERRMLCCSFVWKSIADMNEVFPVVHHEQMYAFLLANKTSTYFVMSYTLGIEIHKHTEREQTDRQITFT